VPRQSLFTLLARALRLRCPSCGRGRFFAGWFSPRARCPECGQPLDRAEDGYYLGALLLNFVGAELTVTIAGLGFLIFTWPRTPWNVLLYGGAALAVVLPFITYPFSKTVWLALDLFIQPNPEDHQP
jgi:uncharacterized protein (DUF983 family)